MCGNRAREARNPKPMCDDNDRKSSCADQRGAIYVMRFDDCECSWCTWKLNMYSRKFEFSLFQYLGEVGLKAIILTENGFWLTFPIASGVLLGEFLFNSGKYKYKDCKDSNIYNFAFTIAAIDNFFDASQLIVHCKICALTFKVKTVRLQSMLYKHTLPFSSLNHLLNPP